MIAGYQKKKCHPDRSGEMDGFLSRDRPRFGGRQADPLCSSTENHNHSPHLRRLGLHHAGGGGQPLFNDPEELENRIATLTGGRAAEEVVFGTSSTGASNDIEQATKLARAMITRYGMSESFDMVALETVNNQYLGGDTSLSCSAQTQAEVDRQVMALVKRQHEKAAQLLQENRKKLDELAKHLYEKETITGEEFMSILNQA